VLRERKLNRKRGYDYSSPGAYFVTICVHGRMRKESVFGSISNGTMLLNEWGTVAERYWEEIPDHYDNVRLDEYCVMPDHIHGIIWIIGITVGTEQCSVPTVIPTVTPPARYGTLSKIIKSFKNAVTKHIGQSIWQRSYYDRIIRDNDELYRIREYIKRNPKNWGNDV
jgi:putative transposase